MLTRSTFCPERKNVPSEVVSVRVLPGESSSVLPGESTFSGGHGRIPRSVGSDPKLKDRDVRVFYALANYERKGIVNTGIRALATCARVPRCRIQASIARLITHGHVQLAHNTGKGKRNSYRLMDPIFAAKAVTDTGKQQFQKGSQGRSVSKTYDTSTLRKARAFAANSSRGSAVDDIFGKETA